MNRIEQKFKELRKVKKKAFIAYIMAGDPSLKISHDLVLELEKQGTDIIELGVPFSDPIADGPTIQKAGVRALNNKVDLSCVLNLVMRLRRKTDIPIILMTYFNILFSYGIKKFAKNAESKGVDGIIVPDLTLEEAGTFIKLVHSNNLSTVFLASPTSSHLRLKKIVRNTTGFVYYVSLTGVTGARRSLPLEIKRNVLRIKKLTSKPVCVGFGISCPEQIKDMFKFSDGVIIGSAIVDKIEKNLDNKNLVKKVGSFVNYLLRR